jgi:hypothetical protein
LISLLSALALAGVEAFVQVSVHCALASGPDPGILFVNNYSRRQSGGDPLGGISGGGSPAGYGVGSVTGCGGS